MNHDMQIRIAYLRRRALMRGHTFTKRTYRKARKYALDRLIAAMNDHHGLLKQRIAAARYGIPPVAYDEVLANASRRSDDAFNHTKAIVNRARREKGMYR